MARFYKLLPFVQGVISAVDHWYFILPVNISPEDFKVCKVEIDITNCDFVDADDEAVFIVSTIYGDAVKGTFLNFSRDVFVYTGAGVHYFQPPVSVELIDIYTWNETKGEDLIDLVVFKAGTERIYDTTKEILKIMTAVDTQNPSFIGYALDTADYDTDSGVYDEFVITISPTLVGDSTMLYSVSVTNACTVDVHWLIRKNVRG